MSLTLLDPTGLTLLVLFAAFLVRSTFGFGDSLVAMPLLLLIMEPTTATPIVALLSVGAGAIIAVESRGHMDWRAASTMIGGAAFGVPLGVMSLKVLSDLVLQRGLGVLLLVYGAWSLARRALPEPIHPRWSWFFGGLGGVFGGATTASGPPVVVFATLRRWSPQATRATLQGYFLVVGSLVAAGHALGGLWTPEVLRLAALGLPGMLVSIVVGRAINRRIPTERFHSIVYALILVLGLLMLLT